MRRRRPGPGLIVPAPTPVSPFASAAWVAELDQALQAIAARQDATTFPSGGSFVIQQVLTEDRSAGGDSAEVAAWEVTFGSGTVRAQLGHAAAPDITFTQSRDVAEAIQRGELSTRQAFMLGALRVGGDTRLLVQHQALLRTLAEAMGALTDEVGGEATP